ncbi:MAG: hypothetical protein AB8H12_10125, partial [Lewinella sp.]
ETPCAERNAHSTHSVSTKTTPQPPPTSHKPTPHVQRVVQHLRTIKGWNPLTGFKGGRIFRNLEGALPKRAVCREYDVLPNLADAREAVGTDKLDIRRLFEVLLKDSSRTERAGIMVLLDDYFLDDLTG